MNLPPRQQSIIEEVRERGYLSIEEMAQMFAVTPQTIRRDINQLAEQGLLRRYHGGAAYDSSIENTAYTMRADQMRDEKQRIAEAVASLVPDNASLFINIGTTTEEVASALSSHQDLLVITNNLNVAMLLYPHPRIEVIVAGGTVRRSDGGVVGSTATQLIGQFKVDYAIIGASAIDEEGALLDFDYREVQVAQAIIANARSVMLVADSTKLHRSAPVRIAHLSQIQTFVTDRPLPDGLASLCHSRGIEVVSAMPADEAEEAAEAAETANPAALRRA